MSIQQKADKAYDDLAHGRISRWDYVHVINDLYYEIPLHLKQSINNRRDYRSLGEFALVIFDNTRRETFLIKEWLKLVEPWGLTPSDRGIANDGRLVIDTRGQSGRVDYILRGKSGRTYNLELKFAPSSRFLTYKVADLQNYLGQGDVLMLTIVGHSSMVGPNGDPASDLPLVLPRGLSWLLMGDQQMRCLLDNGEQGPHRGFGGKPTVRMYDSNFEEFGCALRDWVAVEPYKRNVA
jgi:hypothetical protein